MNASMKQVKFVSQVKQITLQANDIIIVDTNVLKISAIKKLISKNAIYPVRAGEQLKDIKKFPNHIEKIVKLSANLGGVKVRIVAIGGGSVGDFAGFVASTLKRGVELVHIPSTWLAALDSSHGGKTALNVGSFKNQVGTFYAATQIFVCKELLLQQPEALAIDAFGEMLKTFLLDPHLSKTNLLRNEASPETLWKFLKTGIAYKYRIVALDPFEKKGIRSLLNFGHTMGHTFEMLMGWSHGKAILYGLAFDLFWSEDLGTIKNSEFEKLLGSNLWRNLFDLSEYEKALSHSSQKIKKIILQDKKKVSADSIRQVFLKGLGKPEVSLVKFTDLIREYDRQKKYFH